MDALNDRFESISINHPNDKLVKNLKINDGLFQIMFKVFRAKFKIEKDIGLKTTNLSYNELQLLVELWLTRHKPVPVYKLDRNLNRTGLPRKRSERRKQARLMRTSNKRNIQ